MSGAGVALQFSLGQRVYHDHFGFGRIDALYAHTSEGDEIQALVSLEKPFEFTHRPGQTDMAPLNSVMAPVLRLRPADSTTVLLADCAAFLEGFEDDATQEGVPADLLKRIRAMLGTPA